MDLDAELNQLGIETGSTENIDMNPDLEEKNLTQHDIVEAMQKHEEWNGDVGNTGAYGLGCVGSI
ncbi:MAG: hypothetical protein P0S93_02655 [Candidatus Neptunochlamydia sp.]|nr:hypothetical protein [Candidatus Neptunochlamydia sp.]